MNMHQAIALGRNAAYAPPPAELLSPERSAHLAQPMRWLDATAQSHIVDAVRGWFARWCDDWNVPSSDGSPDLVSCVALAEHTGRVDHDALVWRMLSIDSRNVDLWWTLQGYGECREETLTPEQTLQEAWFGGCKNDPDSIAATLAHAAWDDWINRALAWLGATPLAVPPAVDDGASVTARLPCALPTGMLHSWSGAACLRFAWSGRTLSLVVGGAWIDAWLGRDRVIPSVRSPHKASRKAIPLVRAIRDIRVDLRVELAPVEIDLGDLMSLANGDIIRTQHTLDEPLYVSTVTSDSAAPDEFCRAYLGSREASLAIVMVTDSPESAEGREVPLDIRQTN